MVFYLEPRTGTGSTTDHQVKGGKKEKRIGSKQEKHEKKSPEKHSHQTND